MLGIAGVAIKRSLPDAYGVVAPLYIGEVGRGSFWAETSTEENSWDRYRYYVPNWARKRELLGIMPVWPPGSE